MMLQAEPPIERPRRRDRLSSTIRSKNRRRPCPNYPTCQARSMRSIIIRYLQHRPLGLHLLYNICGIVVYLLSLNLGNVLLQSGSTIMMLQRIAKDRGDRNSRISRQADLPHVVLLAQTPVKTMRKKCVKRVSVSQR